ncbi:chloride channel protein [Vogesella sp. LIG4]|uniref:chloride channel protein n=1 Tax=Vogesella sp. LIG4 TaxID=1192162 RepID=UPI00081FE3A9|nr:chloride channel protein [Vogesella sp. LIG4]SCK27947.1 H+/Cl-antiporter ClcA [Vogesella sp. LIG4]
MPYLERPLSRLFHLIHWRHWKGRLVVWSGAILAALVIVAFARLVDWSSTLFNQLRLQSAWLPFLLTPAGGMLITYLTRQYFHGAAGSGIPQVIAALKMAPEHSKQQLVSLRIAIGKVLLGTAALACGFSSGREGPSVQIGASLMYSVRQLLPRRFPIHSHHLILAGGAAGIAAAFNTPLAGIVFAIEELGRKFEERTNGVLLTAIILAGVISISLQGNYTYFGRIVVGPIDSQLALPILLSGSVAGLCGGIFARLMLAGAASWPGLAGQIKQQQPVLFAGLCGLLVALLGYLSDGAVHGSGYLPTQQALSGITPLPGWYAPGKILATLLSYYSGIPGGIFAPSLAVGAGIGQDLANLHLVTSNNAVWIALSMAAFLAAVTQAPITAFVIVMEMIDGHAMVVSLIACAFLASLLSKAISPPLYHTLAHRFTKQGSLHASDDRS